MVRTQASWKRIGAAGVTAVLVILATHATARAAPAKADARAVEDSVRALEAKRAQALLAADTTALSRLVAEEFLEISRLGQVRTKADNLRDIGSGELKLTSVRYDSLTVRVYGQVAVLMGVADNAGTFRGFPFSGRIRYTRVFVLRDKRWQAVAMQQTPMQ